MALSFFKNQNNNHSKLVELILVDQDFAPGTLEKYKTASGHTESFAMEYKINDMKFGG